MKELKGGGGGEMEYDINKPAKIDLSDIPDLKKPPLVRMAKRCRLIIFYSDLLVTLVVKIIYILVGNFLKVEIQRRNSRRT